MSVIDTFCHIVVHRGRKYFYPTISKSISICHRTIGFFERFVKVKVYGFGVRTTVFQTVRAIPDHQGDLEDRRTVAATLEIFNPFNCTPR